jgi:hypothetical protein
MRLLGKREFGPLGGHSNGSSVGEFIIENIFFLVVLVSTYTGSKYFQHL